MDRDKNNGIRYCSMDMRAIDGNKKQFELSFSSEEPYARGGIVEILSHDADAVDLSRFENGTATLLFSHGRDPNYGRVPIGKIIRAWVDLVERKGRAIVELDDEDENCKKLQSKVEKRMITGVSVGYYVSQWTELRAGSKSADDRFSGPANIATRWQPLEISLEPTPADATVGFGRTINDEEEQGTMARVIQGAAIPAQENSAVPALTVPDTKAVQEEAIRAERTRVADITDLCRSLELEPGEFIRSGLSLDEVRAQVLEQLAKSRKPATPGVTIVTDEVDKVRLAATDGLLMRCGMAVDKPAEGAAEFRGMSVRDIAVECLTRSGAGNVLRMGHDELLRRSMTPDSAFVSIMSNTANKVVLAAAATAPTTFQVWTGKGSVSDFRPTEIFEISDSGQLEEIPQNGEIKEGRLSDAPVAVRKLITLGKKFSFTRQAFINNDVDIISRTMTSYVMAFSRGTNKAVYDLLKSNPIMLDGKALFCAEHGNLCAGMSPSPAAFSAARKLMRSQKDLEGVTTLNITPSYVLSSSEDETAIEILLASLADPTGANSGVANIWRNSLKLIVDAELDVAAGAQPYYFASNYMESPTIEVCYLNGNESPMVDSTPEFDRLGMSFRVFGDRGVTLMGYRSMVKNPGTVNK